ncbi:MAG: hypothetical protein ACI837_000781, partial [Crocinitomicaceae bacterium]
MKTILKTQVALFILTILTSVAYAQNSLPSIAVSRPQLSGLST